ncbi:MAG: hypothetical protein AAF585_15930 [Verrucomicrobiota bacterium]
MKIPILTTLAVALAVVGCTGPDVEPDTSSIVGSTLSKITLHQLEGEKFKEAKLTKNPVYYLFYYSASW